MVTPQLRRELVERRDQVAQAGVARARRSRRVGLLLIWLGLVIWLPFVVLAAFSVAGVNTTDAGNVVGSTTVVLSMALIVRGRRMRVGGAEHVLADDRRAPIVYLRPFDTDHTKIATRMSSRLRISPREYVEPTYEERLARTLRKAGPFVAVGDPTERLPLLGAARVYADDSEWRETVDGLTARASVVVIHAGESDGVAWEVGHVIALDAPERVIVSLPLQGKRKERSRQERYDAFRHRFGDAFSRPLPDRIRDCQFLYFDADWRPRLLGERGAQLPDGDAPRALALRELAREFKITWGPAWARYVAYTAAVLAPIGVISALT